MEPSFEIVLVTQQLAKEWLATSESNRPVKKAQRLQYARDMAAGNWRLTGEPIFFDWNGHLVNGHHRLWACIDADAPFKTAVVRGVDPDVRLFMDSGLPWKLADHFAFEGLDRSRELERATRWAWRYKVGDLVHLNRKPTNFDLKEFFLENPGLQESVAIGRDVQKGSTLPQSVASGSWYIASTLNRDAADYFYEKLATGTELPEGSPILALRHWLTSIHRKNFRAQQRVHSVAVIKAWNFFREGREVARIHTPSGTGKKWSMPKMV